MADVVDGKRYMEAMLAAERPGASQIHAFYEHRVGLICTDPHLMLMPWDDHLVHRGDGVFEAMKFVDGYLYQLDQHLERMKRSSSKHLSGSAVFLGRGPRTRAGGLPRRGQGQGHADASSWDAVPAGSASTPPSVRGRALYIVAGDLHPPKPSVYEDGATAFKTSIPAKQSYLATIKSIDYLPNVLMKREAEEFGYDFPFCFDANGFLAEGATENVCIVNANGSMVIPEFTNALAGTTLLRAVDLIKDEMPSVMFRSISEEQIYLAREVIIVGTTGDAISVVRYNGKPIHDVRPGPVAKRIRELLVADLHENGIPL